MIVEQVVNASHTLLPLKLLTKLCETVKKVNRFNFFRGKKRHWHTKDFSPDYECSSLAILLSVLQFSEKITLRQGVFM